MYKARGACKFFIESGTSESSFFKFSKSRFKPSKAGDNIEEGGEFADRIVKFQIRIAQRTRGTIED